VLKHIKTLGGLAVVWKWWKNSHVPRRPSKSLLQRGECCRLLPWTRWTPQRHLMDGHLSLQEQNTVWNLSSLERCMDLFQTQEIRVCPVPFLAWHKKWRWFSFTL